MMLNFFLLLSGPGLAPAIPDDMRAAWLPIATLYVLAGVFVLGVVISLLLRYSESFREFWATHVCNWMEEHAIKSDETKGGM